MRLLPLAAVAAALTAAGCSDGKYPVTGTVKYDDSSPVTRGLVVAERADGGPPITARGDVGPDGRFELSTERPGDGVPPGKYRVLLNPLDTSDVPDEHKVLPFDIKYLRFETSGLEYEVKPGSNELPITVTRSRKKK